MPRRRHRPRCASPLPPKRPRDAAWSVPQPQRRPPFGSPPSSRYWRGGARLPLEGNARSTPQWDRYPRSASPLNSNHQARSPSASSKDAPSSKRLESSARPSKECCSPSQCSRWGARTVLRGAARDAAAWPMVGMWDQFFVLILHALRQIGYAGWPRKSRTMSATC